MSMRTELEFVAPLTYQGADAHYRFEDASFQFEDSEAETEEAFLGFQETSEAFDAFSQNDLGYFMNVAGGYSLLTAEEERSLGLRLWRGRARLLRILRGAARGSGAGARRPPLALEPRAGARPVTASTRRRLARVEKLARDAVEARRFRPPAGSRLSLPGIRRARRRLERTLAEIDDARGRLVEHNLRLVVWVAKRFRGRGFDFIDLIQEGNLGLMRAADRYDPRVGARFSTFATHWIQQGIRRALAEKARTIRIPVNRIPEVRQLLFLRGVLSERLGRLPRPAEIASEMKVPTSKVEEILPALGRIDSIDAPIPMTEKTLADKLEDRSRTPLEAAIEDETRRAVRAVLDELPTRQRSILAMRHGIDHPRECTLDEIGAALGLSRERIRQVEKDAVKTVRDRIRKHRPELARPV